MDLAKRELRETGPHGTVILAEEMTSGRGRSGAKWVSPDEGNLYLTLLLRAAGSGSLNQDRRVQVNLATPLAVAGGIAELVPNLQPKLRWPLTVEVGGRKVSGALIEIHNQDGLEHFAVGVGINVNADFCNNQSFSQAVTSLRCAAQTVMDRELLLAKICDNLEEHISTPSVHELKQRYLAWPSDTSIGSAVSLLNKTSKDLILDGVVTGLTNSLALVVQASNGSNIEVLGTGSITVFPQGHLYKTEL
ncbi:unnamed protein product [Durusdinium trenchii]|uniref:Bifunctional ligase/repressor BirA (Biotin--[acetyl-CoA-carboxylase] ligase) (Biotin--protein ligase) (Biotin-[acetyl-CoA carboxylase] synthetase) n=2 Tax=Durusdinium trenchii TaxID=1381693 RepID=A0ABP0Q2I5_9DINO